MTDTVKTLTPQAPPGLIALDNAPVFMADEEFPTDRTPVWDRVGVQVSQDDTDYSAALEHSHLTEWNVDLMPLQAMVDGSVMSVEGKYLITRMDHPTKHLRPISVVGAKYHPLQNEEAFAWTAKVADHGNPYVCGGEMEDGAKVFLVQKMGEPVAVGDSDPVDLYLVSKTTHDGSGSLEASIVPVIRDSQSSVNITLGRSQRLWKVRHTVNALERTAEAKRAMKLMQDYRQEFEEFSRKMVETPITNKQFREFTRDLFPLKSDAGKRMKSMTTNKRRALAALYYGSPTLDDKYRGTAWAVLHAVTEYVDWFAQVRKAEGDPHRARAIRAMVNNSDQPLKDRAIELLQEM